VVDQTASAMAPPQIPTITYPMNCVPRRGALLGLCWGNDRGKWGLEVMRTGAVPMSLPPQITPTASARSNFA
jgi:hypothetical protein